MRNGISVHLSSDTCECVPNLHFDVCCEILLPSARLVALLTARAFSFNIRRVIQHPPYNQPHSVSSVTRAFYELRTTPSYPPFSVILHHLSLRYNSPSLIQCNKAVYHKLTTTVVPSQDFTPPISNLDHAWARSVTNLPYALHEYSYFDSNWRIRRPIAHINTSFGVCPILPHIFFFFGHLQASSPGVSMLIQAPMHDPSPFILPLRADDTTAEDYVARYLNHIIVPDNTCVDVQRNIACDVSFASTATSPKTESLDRRHSC